MPEAYSKIKTQNKMKTKLFLLTTLIIIAASCNKDCERGEGQKISQTYSVNEFHGVEYSAQGDVEIIKSNEHKFVIEAQPNVIAQFKYHIKNDKLIIGADCFNSQSSAESLSIKVSGDGDVNVVDMLSKTCNIKISGLSECKVNVQNTLNINISGNGKIYYKGNPQIIQNVSGLGSIERLD